MENTVALPARLTTMARYWSEDVVTRYITDVEYAANNGIYRGRPLPHGVQWLRVAPHGTECASEHTAAVLDTAHAQGRVTFTDDNRDVGGCHLTITQPGR